MDPLDQPASAVRLRQLAGAGLLSPPELERALAHAGHLPTPRAWARFAGLALLLAGAALCLVGIFFFFAYNWADLHRFAKFALIQAALLAAAGYALWRGLERLDGQVALFAACALVGVLLAVFGQVYQTGADAYTLFLFWATLIAVPTLLARNAPLWMLFAVLLNLSLYYAWEQRIADFWDLRPAALFALNAVLLLAWELVRGRGAAWMRPPWYGRALLALAAWWGTVLLLGAIDSRWITLDGTLPIWIAPIVALALGGLAAHHYLRRAPDLPALSLLALCAIVIITAQISQLVGWDSTFSFLLLGVLVLAQVAVATLLLLRAARRMGVPQ